MVKMVKQPKSLEAYQRRAIKLDSHIFAFNKEHSSKDSSHPKSKKKSKSSDGKMEIGATKFKKLSAEEKQARIDVW